MPAFRSRTENWRVSLEQICERGGALELAVRTPADDARGPHIAGDASTPAAPDMVWRVRVLRVDENEILVAPPAVAGKSVALAAHLPLLASFVVGQNRWAFRSEVAACRPAPAGSGENICFALTIPEHVARCPRRAAARQSTAGFNLPEVALWPVLEPASIAAADEASRALLTRSWVESVAEDSAVDVSLPVVGPRVTASLLNISGGGVGLMLTPSAASVLERAGLIWAQVSLRPHIPMPLGVTLKRVHSHLESTGEMYFGCALDFTWAPASQTFIAELFTRYMACMQRGGGKAGVPATVRGIAA
ncbi:hypothetical protein BH11PLA1_BH11PLA1_09460 [soil metagenome]